MRPARGGGGARLAAMRAASAPPLFSALLATGKSQHSSQQGDECNGLLRHDGNAWRRRDTGRMYEHTGGASAGGASRGCTGARHTGSVEFLATPRPLSSTWKVGSCASAKYRCGRDVRRELDDRNRRFEIL